MKPFWEFQSRCMKNKPLNWVTVSAVHSQLCRALEKSEFKMSEWKQFEQKPAWTRQKRVGMNLIFIQHAHERLNTTSQQLLTNVWFLTEVLSSLYLWASRCLWRFGWRTRGLTLKACCSAGPLQGKYHKTQHVIEALPSFCGIRAGY